MRAKVRIVAAIGVLLFSVLSPGFADATQLTRASVRLGRLGISAATNNDLLVTFKLNTTPTTVAKITVTFPAAFTITTGTPAVGTSGFPNTPASITAPPGALTSAATAASKTIVVSGLTSASLNNTTLYGFTIPTGTVTNPATAGQYNVTVESDTAASALIDLTTTPVFVFGASANLDQVVVSESVAPNFSFSLSANTDTIPKVDTTTIQTSTGITMTVGTNSPLGYTAYIKSANNALTSATTPGTPIATGTFNAAPDPISVGNTLYGLVPSTGTACTTCTGALTYDGEYNAVDAAHVGSFAGVNTFSSVVSRNGYTNADLVIFKERYAVGPTIGYANDYTDTLTIVAAGNY